MVANVLGNRNLVFKKLMIGLPISVRINETIKYTITAWIWYIKKSDIPMSTKKPIDLRIPLAIVLDVIIYEMDLINWH